MINTRERIARLQDNIELVIKGKSEVVRLTIVTLLGRGHLLIEDVPGVGKTTLAQALARSLSLSFRRIQFTSDLLPSDILGVTIYNQQTQAFEFKPGPIFANIIVADEINRTTPKTQSSLLEVMSEEQVTIDSRTHPLPHPFMVMATQNPFEYHGTFPLPESQLDRFMLRIEIGYPVPEDEKTILKTLNPMHSVDDIKPVLTGKEVEELQREVDRVKVDDSLVDYLLAITQATRATGLLNLGVSPRGAISLQKAMQALALVEGRDYCIPDDIKQLAPLAFAHRVIVNNQTNGWTKRRESAEQIIRELVDKVPVPV
jgi:MoxR-like ATPase